MVARKLLTASGNIFNFQRGKSSSSPSAFPVISVGFTILGEIFAYVTLFICF